eukprot:TRINITY_DN656_c0_g1_i6.p1 TRINITY_DN656_c0_g1~~TRINITY_DN656_c0_g1_i6.p1  ORF type:complete len:133 (+),score=37.37 TRINITY_DN656_c0_g1_i6:74-472(+)
MGFFRCVFFFFFNDTATTEIYTRSIVGSVRCVQETVSTQSTWDIKITMSFWSILDKSLDEIFNIIDKDKNGYICSTELREFVNHISKALGRECLTDAELKEGMEDLDTNKDGKLSREEAKPFVVGLFNLKEE